MRQLFLFIVALFASTAFAQSQPAHLKFDNVWARPAAAGQVSAVYLSIKNTGATDKLLAASCDCAKAVELHSTQMHGGTMHMQPVSAIELPTNGEATLKPGGNHIMLINLTRPLAAGETLPLQLKFQQAGEVKLTVPVRDNADAAHSH